MFPNSVFIINREPLQCADFNNDVNDYRDHSYWFSNRGTGRANINTPSSAVNDPIIYKNSFEVRMHSVLGIFCFFDKTL